LALEVNQKRKKIKGRGRIDGGGKNLQMRTRKTKVREKSIFESPMMTGINKSSKKEGGLKQKIKMETRGSY